MSRKSSSATVQRCKTFWTNLSENSARVLGLVYEREFCRGGQVHSRKNGSRWGKSVLSLEPLSLNRAVFHPNS